jgi:hypothetical protein
LSFPIFGELTQSDLVGDFGNFDLQALCSEIVGDKALAKYLNWKLRQICDSRNLYRVVIFVHFRRHRRVKIRAEILLGQSKCSMSGKLFGINNNMMDSVPYPTC